jgi:hypothetical protein
MKNASDRLPRFDGSTGPPRISVDASIVMTSNIASPRTTNSAAIPALNHGDELMVPNVPAVTTTIPPITP